MLDPMKCACVLICNRKEHSHGWSIWERIGESNPELPFDDGAGLRMGGNQPYHTSKNLIEALRIWL